MIRECTFLKKKGVKNMSEELTKLEITKEELEELTAEELADLKIELEELLMECEDILEDDDNEEIEN